MTHTGCRSRAANKCPARGRASVMACRGSMRQPAAGEKHCAASQTMRPRDAPCTHRVRAAGLRPRWVSIVSCAPKGWPGTRPVPGQSGVRLHEVTPAAGGVSMSRRPDSAPWSIDQGQNKKAPPRAGPRRVWRSCGRPERRLRVRWTTITRPCRSGNLASSTTRSPTALNSPMSGSQPLRTERRSSSSLATSALHSWTNIVLLACKVDLQPSETSPWSRTGSARRQPLASRIAFLPSCQRFRPCRPRRS
jgi:hypothetical protein